jgi:ComF family protein
MDTIGLLFPRKCFGCGKFDSYICEDCVKSIPKVKQICAVCKKPSRNGYTHLRCKKEGAPDRLISVFPYKGAVKKAILTMKYKFAYDIGKSLAQLTFERWGKIKGKYLLAPLPLHEKRFNWRGFNQSEEIGKHLAKLTGWRFVPDLLIKKKMTKPQVELGKEERHINVKNVFSINPKYLGWKLKSNVILLDDVWTTGTTMKEGIKALKTFGFKKVWGLAVAKSGVGNRR